MDGTRLACPTAVRKRPAPVLIVDDDSDILDVERRILDEHGFRVISARDGADALRALEHEAPSVIVLDIQMPGVDGPAFAERLRKRLRHVPLVVVTGAPDARREADRCNAEAFLRKPFDADDLVRVVRRFAA